jgi:flagellar biosynthesis protein FlhB
MAVTTTSTDLKVGSVYREAGRTYRSHPVALLVPGAILFLAFGVPSALFGEATTDQGAGAVVAALLAQSLGALSSFLYYGYCEEVADQARSGEVSVRRALNETRPVVLKLAAVSVVVELLVGLGLVLFIVPGVLLAVRWGLVAPIASFEKVWPRRAMRRSAELVKGHFRLVLVTAVAMFVLEQVASAAGEALGSEVVGDHIVGAVLGDAAGDLMVGPFAGLLIAIVYFRLSGRGEA